MADKQISQLVAASTINNEDLFVLQQGGTAKKLSGQTLSDFVYQSAADQIERVNEAVEQTQAAVNSLEEQKNEIAQTIADMAELGTDTTLSTPGMAADAAATGEVKDIALANFAPISIGGVQIATFDDGANNVPVQSLTVDIKLTQSGSGDPSTTNVRTITGFNKLDLFSSGKNLLGGDALIQELKRHYPSLNPSTSTAGYGRYYTFTSSQASNRFKITSCFKPNTRYTLLLFMFRSSAGGSNIYVRYTDGSSDDIGSIGTSPAYKRYVTSAGKSVASITGANQGGTTTFYLDKSGIFEGVVNTVDYEDWKGTCKQFTFTEAGTVYGGTLDVKNNKLSVTKIGVDLASITWSTQYTGEVNKSLSGETGFFYSAINVTLIAEKYIYLGSVSAASEVEDPDNKDIGIRTYKPSSATSATSEQVLYIVLPVDETPSGLCVYDLYTPIEYDLTPTDIRTLLGITNIWANTGDVIELTYFKQALSDDEIIEKINGIKEIISDTENSNVASKNYSSGDLVIVGDMLLEVTSAIAEGETIDIGINCQETTVAEQLAYLKSIIESIGNVASLNYDNA